MCHLRPQAGDRYCEHALAERYRLLGVAENEPELEILAAGRGQLSKPLEIAGSDSCGRFNLNTNYISTLTFHDDVYFVLILISVVVEPAGLGQPIHLFHDLREGESLQQRAKDRSILTDPFLGGTQDRSQQTRIKKVQLGSLHQSLEPIAEPRFYATNQEQLLEDGYVLSCRFVIKTNLTADLREVGQLTGVVSKHFKDARHLVHLLYLGDIAHVALHDCVDVTASPRSAPLSIPSLNHLRVTAGEHCVCQIISNQTFGCFGDSACHRLLQKCRSLLSDLSSRERQKIHY